MSQVYRIDDLEAGTTTLTLEGSTGEIVSLERVFLPCPLRRVTKVDGLDRVLSSLVDVEDQRDGLTVEVE